MTIGWLPYGSSDASVVWAHPLTREIVAADVSGKWGTITKQGSGNTPTHDSVLGMKAVDSSGADAAYRLNNAVAAAIDPLDKGFQYRIELSRALVCANTAAALSVGDVPATAARSPFSMFDTTTVSVDFLQKGNTGSGAFSQSIGTSAANDYRDEILSGSNMSSLYIHSVGKGDYVTVNGAWWGGLSGGTHMWAIDGLPVAYGVMNVATAVRIFQNFYIGSRRGAANSFVNQWWMRNLQLASSVPVFASHPLLSSVVILSDSITDEVLVNAQPSYDVSTQYQFRRRFYQRGMKPAKMAVDENGGYKISIAAQLESRVSAVLARQPTIVIISGGINDIVNVAYNSATFLAEYKDLIEQLFLGTAKTSRTSVRYVVPIIIQPHATAVTDSTYASNHADARAHIASLPAWWNSTYGATYGNDRVVTSDMWTEFSSSHSTMTDLNISSDGVHLAALGNYKFGNRLYETVAGILSKPF